MTEFTLEFIEEQQKLMVALPKHLSVGIVHKNHVNINQNFDSKPIPTILNIMDVNIFSTMPETCLTAQSICDACNNYPNALDALLDVTKKLAKTQTRVQELEEKYDLVLSQRNHAYDMLGWSREISIDEFATESKLKQSIAELRAEIKESNSLLRSAFMIAKRDGKDTNWEAWRKQLDDALSRQYAMMHPQEEE